MNANSSNQIASTPMRDPHQHNPSVSGYSTGSRSFPVKRLNPDDELPLTQPSLKDLFKGVVAHVDVRADCDNRSAVIAAELERYGAKVLKKFSKNATHVVFKNGSKAVYDKAKLLKIPIVSSMWIDACREQGQLVPESAYPPFCAQQYDSPFAKIKRVRSMQPRPLEENLKLVSRQIARKRRKQGEQLCDRSFEDCQPSFSPPRSLATGIDFFVENSPAVRERLRQKLAAGTPYHRLFEFDDDEDENDTPLSFNVIKKYYFSPNKPPPESIRKIMAEVGANDKADPSEYAASPVLSKRSNGSLKSACSLTQESASTGTVPSPVKALTEKRKWDSAEEADMPPPGKKRTSSCGRANLLSPGSKENETILDTMKRRVTRSSSRRACARSSSPNQIVPGSTEKGSVSSAEGRRCSARLKAKSFSQDSSAEKGPKESQKTCRKVLFNRKKKLLLPESLIVAATPPEEVSRRRDNQHPCFSQPEKKPRGRRKAAAVNTGKDNGPCAAKAAVDADPIVEPIARNRNSLDEFALDKPRKKSAKLKDKKGKKTIVCTSLHQDQIRRVHYVIKYLGGFTMADVVDARTSFIVCGSPRRTLNVMHGIVHGANLVTFQWALDCESSGEWLSADTYSVDPFSSAAAVYCNYRLTRQRPFLLFTHLGRFYLSPRSTVPVDDLSRLVAEVGGTLTNNIREADYVIGEVYRSSKVTCLQPVWVLDCIQQCQILPMNNFLLSPR